MKGLIIKPKWADLILDGKKTVEIRANKTNIRGVIGIIKSGSKKVYGTAELFHCTELTKENFKIWKDRHRLDITYGQLLTIYPKPYAWCLTKINKFNSPMKYEHKQGCVVWVNI